MDPTHAFWLVPGPNGEPSAVQTAHLLLTAAPWLSGVGFPAGGFDWKAERLAAGGWRLIQLSGQNPGKVRHRLHEKALR